MTTFTLKDKGNVPVKLPDGLSQEQILSFRPFNSWIETFNKSLSLQSNKSHPFHADPYQLRSITVQSYDMFGAKRLGFVKLTTEVTNSASESIPGAVFLRGPSVAMLVLLVPDDAPADTTERYALLTVQPRVAAGSLAFVELPAGMVDEGQFAGTAAKEIKEELGLEIPESELTCLSELAGVAEQEQDEGLAMALYPSPGACDEYMQLYLHEKRVPRSQLREWTGRLTGLRDEGERITLKLVKYQDLWREGARDAKCLAALALYEALKREAKL